MKIVTLSDVHNQYKKVEIPEADVILFAGDLTSHGSKDEVKKFASWCKNLPYKHKIVVAGNHDFFFQKFNKEARQLMIDSGLTYLEDEEHIIDGIKFYGSPWQPWFYNWAFNLERGSQIRKKWDLIPKDTDVLITHGPPYGILDRTPNGEDVGCSDLKDIVVSIKPKAHIFGHIHHSYGFKNIDSTLYINTSICNERYQPVNKPFLFEL